MFLGILGAGRGIFIVFRWFQDGEGVKLGNWINDKFSERLNRRNMEILQDSWDWLVLVAESSTKLHLSPFKHHKIWKRAHQINQSIYCNQIKINFQVQLKSIRKKLASKIISFFQNQQLIGIENLEAMKNPLIHPLFPIKTLKKYKLKIGKIDWEKCEKQKTRFSIFWTLIFHSIPLKIK